MGYETRFSFQPSRPWLPGTYTIEVSPLLEDVAGNRVNRAFDVDAGDRVTTIDESGGCYAPRVCGSAVVLGESGDAC